MISTEMFKTRSEIIDRSMPRINGNNQYKGKTVVALDGGYSAVKGVSPERLFCFPSFAKKIDKELEAVGDVRSFDIQYKDNKSGAIYLVGQNAMNLIEQADIDSVTDASLYTRYRYDSDIYKVVMSTGLAIGCIGSGSNEIFLQTGLPATYKERDEKKLISALSGDYDISIKLGAKPWMRFQFTLPEDHIFVMEQPQGTLCGCAYTVDGVSAFGRDILKSNTIILDLGFGTEDHFVVKAGYKNAHQTYTDTAMKSVFEETLKELSRSYPIENKIFELQNHLDTGKITYIDPYEFPIVMHEIDFSKTLEQKNHELCDKSIRRLLLDYDNLKEYRYLIVSGGTGEARFEQIRDTLKGITTLNVISGNIAHPDIPCIYNNVMGYYIFRYTAIVKQMKKLGQ